MKKFVLIIVISIVCIYVRAEESAPSQRPYEPIVKLLYWNDSIASFDIDSVNYVLVDTIVLSNYRTYAKNEDVAFLVPKATPSRKLKARYLLHNKESYFLIQYLSVADNMVHVLDLKTDSCLWDAIEYCPSPIYGLVFLIQRDFFDLTRVPVYDRRTFPCARRRMKYYRAIFPVCEDFYNQYVRSGRPIRFYKAD